jgi:PEP-CTERM motif-containing protein
MHRRESRRAAGMLIAAVCACCCLMSSSARASALTYQWAGTLDHCVDEGGIYCDWWGGAAVGGSLTFDTSSGAYTDFGTSVAATSFTWLGPRLPDTDPSDTFQNAYEGDASGGLFHVTILVRDRESQWVDLAFAQPLAGQAEVDVSGYVNRRFAGPNLFYRFDDAEAMLVAVDGIPVPEPSALLLLGSTIAVVLRRRSWAH